MEHCKFVYNALKNIYNLSLSCDVFVSIVNYIVRLNCVYLGSLIYGKYFILTASTLSIYFLQGITNEIQSSAALDSSLNIALRGSNVPHEKGAKSHINLDVKSEL